MSCSDVVYTIERVLPLARLCSIHGPDFSSQDEGTRDMKVKYPLERHELKRPHDFPCRVRKKSGMIRTGDIDIDRATLHELDGAWYKSVDCNTDTSDAG